MSQATLFDDDDGSTQPDHRRSRGLHLTRTEGRVLDAVRAADPEPVTVADVARATGLSSAGMILHRLWSAQAVQRVARPEGGYAWRLATAAPASAEQQRPTAVEARDRAIDRVEDAADPDWLERATRVVERVCLERIEFSTDAVWAYIERPREPRALGAVMRIAVANAWCEPTDRTRRSADSTCHARPKRIWRSLLFRSASP